MQFRKPEIDDVWESIIGDKKQIHITSIEDGKITFIGKSYGTYFVGYESRYELSRYYRFVKSSRLNASQLF